MKLQPEYENVFKNFKKQFRQNLRTEKRRAEKGGLNFRVMKSRHDLKAFHEIMLVSNKVKHNMFSRPYSLFKNCFDILRPGEGIQLFIAEHGKEIAGGIIFLFFKNKAFYLWSSTSLRYGRFGVNALLLEKAIQHCCEMRYEFLDLGITGCGQENLRFFKSRFGGADVVAPQYFAMINQKTPPEIDAFSSFEFVEKIIKFTPMPLFRFFSSIISKHTGAF
ncbi:MAG: GNAT family N-acetyltransferase [Omnitrophica bacterium]|nr:GNAT family N-acetyltransferase [Candidatus Omnitrophota bacterium]